MPFDGDVKQYEARPRVKRPRLLTVDQQVELALTRAAELIQRGWCKNTLARTLFGEEVSALSPEATNFCSIGALDRAQFELRFSEGVYWGALERLENETEIGGIEGWNDARSSKRPVLNAFKRAGAKI